MSSAGSGLVVVDKPAGITSHDVVARVRRLSGTRKVGHAGTLDPMATGVLVLGVNRATRLLGHLMLTDKSYDATIRLGVVTTTDDAEGQAVSTTDASAVDQTRVREVLAGLVGEVDQVPAAVSAVKVDGRRAYQRVRDGEEVELAPRRVRIDELLVTRVGPPGPTRDLDVSVRCSSGTYVRAIARDLGAALGVGGHLTRLRRTAVGRFGLDQAHSLESLSERLVMVSMTHAARATFAAYDLDPRQAADVRVGRLLELDLDLPEPVAVFAPDGEFLALYQRRGPGVARPVAVFTG